MDSRLKDLRRWANIGLSGLMKEHPLGEFVLLADVQAALAAPVQSGLSEEQVEKAYMDAVYNHSNPITASEIWKVTTANLNALLGASPTGAIGELVAKWREWAGQNPNSPILKGTAAARFAVGHCADELEAALQASAPAFDALKATPSAFTPPSAERLQRLEDEASAPATAEGELK